MAGLDNIPQKQSVEIEIVKLDEDILKNITELNQKSANIISEFGQIYIRKEEIQEELVRLDDFLQSGKDEFKSLNAQLKQIVDALDDKYPQGRIDLQNGVIQYQPGAPSRKQLAEQQKQQSANSNDMKVVKD
jgi:predicted nuclease with TOPRIM domain